MSDSASESEPDARPSLGRVLIAEGFGTFLLVFFGCGVVHVDVLFGALGLGAVALVWGLAIMLAIFAVGAISGAHLNPAVTIAFAAWKRHPWGQVLPYIAAQLVGAMVAAFALFILFSGHLAAKEAEKGVKRGEPGSVITAMCYGEYFPNPGSLGAGAGPYDAALHEALDAKFSRESAALAELLGTMILAIVVFAVTDARNVGRPLANLAPVFIGLTVTALICVLAPLTQACFNPARDFGPRLFAYWAGWNSVALPGPRAQGWLVVYILAPIVGALAGGGFYEGLLRPSLSPLAHSTVEETA